VTISSVDRVVFLKKIHLFRGLDDDQLTTIAARLEEQAYQAGKAVFMQGDEADSLFLIHSGTVRIMRMQKNKPEQLALLAPEDYFGEEELFNRERRSASVYTETDALFFVMALKDLKALIDQIRTLKPNFEVAISSRRLARQLQFGWLAPGEVIYFLARKHPILLWEAMLAPAFLLIVPASLFVGFLLTTRAVFIYLAIAVLLLEIAWTIWRAVDWGNDYYIVTNLRVIWLEKVVALYDSRQEAPLSTILSVGVETDQTGRMLDYGDVIVRTFVGRISFHHVSHPYQAASMIEEYWLRAKSSSHRANVEALKRSIRQKLGLPVEEEGRASASSPVPKVVTNNASRLKAFLDTMNIFKVRFEDKRGTITYRKHWIVLFEQTWQPGAFFLVMLGLSIYRFIHLPTPSAGVAPTVDPFLAVFLIGLVFAFFWWIYQYWDWSNDIFQVTLDQVLDIDRKPLGREERKAAALDNIQSTEADRRGLFQVLFNYGDVYIAVGGTRMDFFDVFDPSGVQQDIDRRRMARIERKSQAEAVAERERLADFFVMYHQSTPELRRDQEARLKGGIQEPGTPDETDIPENKPDEYY